MTNTTSYSQLVEAIRAAGLEKTNLQMVATATAINLHRQPLSLYRQPLTPSSQGENRNLM